MFQKYRKQSEKFFGGQVSTKGLVAAVLFGAIILVFVFFGMPGKQSSMGAGAAAEVNSSLISVADLRTETQRMEQMYGQYFGGMDLGMQRQFIQERALENLIQAELISQAAQDVGIWSTDAEVRDIITKDIPAFQQEGRFRRDYYQGYLDSTRMAAGIFEDKIRKDRRSFRVRHLLEISAQPLSIELQKQKQLEEVKLNVSYLNLDESKLKVTVTPSEAEKALSDSEKLKSAEEYFKAHISEYSQEEQVKAQHILVKAKKGDSAEEKKALARIEEIQSKLDSSDFGVLAEQYSDDPGSKDKKGDLGFFSRGRMVPEFEKAAFDLKIGKVSEPIQTAYGYHLIKVLEKKDKSTAKFEDVKLDVMSKMLKTQKVDTITKKAEEIVKKENEAELNSFVKEMGLNWEETGLFAMNVDQVPKINSQVASKNIFELNQQKPILNRIVRDGSSKFIFKLKEIKKEESKTKMETKVAQLARERAYDIFGNWIEEYRKGSKVTKNGVSATRE